MVTKSNWYGKNNSKKRFVKKLQFNNKCNLTPDYINNIGGCEKERQVYAYGSGSSFFLTWNLMQILWFSSLPSGNN